MADYYRAPGWFTRNVFNQLVAFLTRQGISVRLAVLAVKGRTSGQWRTTPVNLLTHDGRRYLVAARGETQWVRNLRASGTGELRVGRRAESFRGTELTDDEKVPVLRAYLKRWRQRSVSFPGHRAGLQRRPDPRHRARTQRSRCYLPIPGDGSLSARCAAAQRAPAQRVATATILTPVMTITRYAA